MSCKSGNRITRRRTAAGTGAAGGRAGGADDRARGGAERAASGRAHGAQRGDAARRPSASRAGASEFAPIYGQVWLSGCRLTATLRQGTGQTDHSARRATAADATAAAEATGPLARHVSSGLLPYCPASRPRGGRRDYPYPNTRRKKDPDCRCKPRRKVGFDGNRVLLPGGAALIAVAGMSSSGSSAAAKAALGAWGWDRPSSAFKPEPVHAHGGAGRGKGGVSLRDTHLTVAEAGIRTHIDTHPYTLLRFNFLISTHGVVRCPQHIRANPNRTAREGWTGEAGCGTTPGRGRGRHFLERGMSLQPNLTHYVPPPCGSRRGRATDQTTHCGVRSPGHTASRSYLADDY